MTMEDILKDRNKVKEIIDGFVDNTSIFTNLGIQDIKSLLYRLQQDGNIWANLLRSAGGELELTKCIFLLVILEVG
jgi:hypothetical protein